MSFFRRKDPSAIPLPPSRAESAISPQSYALRRDRSPGPPSYQSNASQDSRAPVYNAGSNSYFGDQKVSQDNRNDGSQPGSGGLGGRSNVAVSDPYSRGFGNVEADRNELFSGYNPDNAGGGRNRFDDRPPGGGSRGGGRRWQDSEPANQEEEEEDVERIKQDTKQLKNESLTSTRNALRLAREAEETARATLNKLGDQSERIGNTERLLDKSKGHTSRAEDKTSEIKQLNRSIFRPVIVFNKEGKRQKEEQRLADRHAAEREERERAMIDVRESQNRIGRAQVMDGEGDEDPYGKYGGQGSGRFGRKNLTEAQQNARLAGRSRFQFEKSASDDELEDNLDDNLDEIHDVTKRLKALAAAQGEELDNQNARLGRLDGNAAKLDDKINRATDRLKRL